jgi:hypothetical protein
MYIDKKKIVDNICYSLGELPVTMGLFGLRSPEILPNSHEERFYGIYEIVCF